MKKNIWIILGVIVIVGLVYYFYSAPSYNTSNNSVKQPVGTETNVAPKTTIAVQTVVLGTSTKFGSYLEASDGMTLYTYGKDKAGVSNCSGSCAANWPPYTVSSGTILTPGSGVSGALATIKRTDGSMQITYNGLPLYFWVGDHAVGDVTGNGVGSFSVAK